jgi:hypothetical protein
MNKGLVSQESSQTSPRANLIRLSRSLAGASIGILVFTIILLLLKVLSKSPAYLTLLFPGIVVIDALGLSSYPNNVLTNSIAYIVSCLPSAILGLLIISKNKKKRIVGLGLLTLYLIFSLGYGLLLVLFMSD